MRRAHHLSTFAVIMVGTLPVAFPGAAVYRPANNARSRSTISPM